MLPDIPEPDWKVLRSLHPLTLERFCQRVLGEVSAQVSDPSKSAHQRYLDTYKLIHERDKELGWIFDDLRRFTAMDELCHLRRENLISNEEFALLSEETRATLEARLKAG